MNLLNKLTAKNLKLNKKRTVVTIIGIILSAALLAAVASFYASGVKSLIRYEIEKQGNYHVAFYSVPVSDLELFRNNRAIEKICLTQNVGYADIESANEYKPYVYIKEFTKEALENLTGSLVEGRMPENENEIVIPTHLKTNGRNFLKVGDSVTLEVGQRIDGDGNLLSQFDAYLDNGEEQIVNTTEKTYAVVGIAERPSKNIEGFSAPGYTFITYIDQAEIKGNVDVYVRYTKDGAKNWEEITADLSGENEEADTKYETACNAYLIALETDPFSISAEFGVATVIVLGIIVVTSIFCIKNSFDISITEKIKQYGMLRSVGATKKQIRKNVFFEATVLGLSGIPLGIFFGCLAAYILVIVSNFFMKDEADDMVELVFALSPAAILVSVILGIITIYFSAFRSARRASRVSPIDSIRNSADIKLNSKRVKIPGIIKKIFGIGGEISYKNLKRNGNKYRTTVISIAVSVVAFIAVSSFIGLVLREADRDLKISDYNVYLSAYTSGSEGRYNKYLSTVTLENIDNYTILRETKYEVERVKYNSGYLDWINMSYEDIVRKDRDSYLYVYALGNEQYRKYIKSLGLRYEDIKDKAIVMDYERIVRAGGKGEKYEYKNMRIYDYKVGDVVIDKATDKALQIGYVTNVKPFGLKNENAHYLIVSDEMFESLLMGEVTDSVRIFYYSSNADKLQDDLDELLKSEQYYYINNMEESVRSRKKAITLIGIFLYGFIIVISLIGITNVFNTITTNMELRKPEFAMLKSVGMTTKEFDRMIRLESLFMGVKSLLIGVPGGIAVSYLMYYSMKGDIEAPYRFPAFSVITAMALVFMLISLIMRYSMGKIRKQNIIETIRNENI